MSDTSQPEYGTERIVLIGPKRKGGKHTLRRDVFAQQGFTTFYDPEVKDFGHWNGSWQCLEVLGQFDSADEAREFMLARTSETNASRSTTE